MKTTLRLGELTEVPEQRASNPSTRKKITPFSRKTGAPGSATALNELSGATAVGARGATSPVRPSPARGETEVPARPSPGWRFANASTGWARFIRAGVQKDRACRDEEGATVTPLGSAAAAAGARTAIDMRAAASQVSDPASAR